MRRISVTVPEAVAMSGLGRTTLYKLFKLGELRPRKCGKRTLILVEDLENYLTSLPVNPRAK